MHVNKIIMLISDVVLAQGGGVCRYSFGVCCYNPDGNGVEITRDGVVYKWDLKSIDGDILELAKAL